MPLQIPSSTPELLNWLFFIVASGLGAYLTIRIKNLATKEDMADITKKIEQVKYEFTKQSEEMKANLSLATQHKLNVKKEQRDALIHFHSKMSDWLHSLEKHASVAPFSESYADFKAAYDSVADKKYELDLALSNIRPLVSNKILLESIDKAMQHIYSYEEMWSKYVFECHTLQHTLQLEQENQKTSQETIDNRQSFEIISDKINEFTKVYENDELRNIEICRNNLNEVAKIINEIITSLDNMKQE